MKLEWAAAALGSVPKLEVAQDSFDNRAIVDQTDELHGETAAGTGQGIGFVNWPQWRGPAGLQISPEPDPPDQWSDTLNVV